MLPPALRLPSYCFVSLSDSPALVPCLVTFTSCSSFLHPLSLAHLPLPFPLVSKPSIPTACRYSSLSFFSSLSCFPASSLLVFTLELCLTPCPVLPYPALLFPAFASFNFHLLVSLVSLSGVNQSVSLSAYLSVSQLVYLSVRLFTWIYLSVSINLSVIGSNS